MTTKLIVTQTKSTIGCTERMTLTVRGLGLKRIGQTVELPDHPAIRGMVTRVQHLVEVQVKEGAPKLSGARHRNKKKSA